MQVVERVGCQNFPPEFKANREGGFEHEKDGYLYVHGFMPDGFKHPKNFCTAR